MCFHTSTTNKVKRLETFFKVNLSDQGLRSYFNKPNYHHNGFSHPNMLVIPQQQSESLAPGIWGIVPSDKNGNEIKPYYKESIRFGGGLNARSEKVFDHFIYKNSIMKRRCIIPVSGFFEPHTYKSKKYPFYFRNKDNSPLALAGIYTVIESFITFTILTKVASPLFEKIHNSKNRQPVIFTEKDSKQWLNDSLEISDISELIKKHYSESRIETFPVSKDLFNPKKDSNVENIINEVEYRELVM
ncbi:putative SOS response-associated peptidase YedK [Winogradskyella eximia]|uniref:Abasic site processing protein n=1 Tax=Winogradskyella eximia TaxID=262006 RepID=A0A3D9H2H8_9FLAO|nr:SOS response-associated peptidase [Winogradskyella eximia]RED43685.1 putative SOS response-associated peptidase YedK [Winogradskyella eximia]